jgi:penicillin amidase
MAVLRIFLVVLGIAVLVTVIGAAALVIDTTQGVLPQISGTTSIPGLTDQAEVLRDSYGTPHIYASNLYDLFFMQGYVHAQDRWWQMEFMRHVGRGAIQELTGSTPDLLGTDIFLRTVGLRQAAERDFADLDEQARVLLDAFSDGVNAYILSRAPDDLAMEYRLLGFTGVRIDLEPWTSVDSLTWGKTIAWNLTNSHGRELTRLAILEAIGESMLRDYVPPYPYGERVTILDADDLAASEAAAAAPISADGTVITGRLAGSVQPGDELAAVGLLSSASDAGIGSNNWVATGSMTEDAQAMLANDPHLGIAMPSIWYEVGLHCLPVTEDCPMDVVGFTFAMTPGVIGGHNAHIAWGITNVGADVQDLYRIRVNPDNPLQYEWNGAWRDMTLREEVIRFGDGEQPLTLQIRETHLGPIINDNAVDEATGQISGFNNTDPLALRWTGYEPNNVWGATLALNFATHWEEFRAALSGFAIPSQNFVYADTAGNIGYQMPGLMPIRAPGHDGLTPADGWTDEYVWRGFIAFDDLPRTYNPARDYIATANNAVVPEAYYASLQARYDDDSRYVLSYDWSFGYRAQRIDDLLRQRVPHTVETFQRIQTDNYNAPAMAIMPYVANLFIDDPIMAEVRDWLRAYDGIDSADSPYAPLANMVMLSLIDNTFNDQLPEDILASSHQMFALERLVEVPNHAWWDDATTPDVTEDRDGILLRSLREAYDETVALLSDDRSRWTWGALHTATFVSSPMGASGISVIEDIFNRGAFGVSGGYEVVNATSWSAEDVSFEVAGLPSYRMIIDLNNFDASLSIHTTGASAHPFSAHYDNLIELWRTGQYKPMLFTRTAVERAAAHRLVANPG